MSRAVLSEQPADLAKDDHALVGELYPMLRRFAAVVGPAEVDPDDLVQEALLRRLEKGPLTDLEHPGAYLRRTMYNLASNHRRSLARKRAALARLVGRGDYLQPYPSDIQELMRLSPLARASLYLTVVEGRTYTDVAELLDCSEESVRKAASRGRLRLRSVLSEEERNATA